MYKDSGTAIVPITPTAYKYVQFIEHFSFCPHKSILTPLWTKPIPCLIHSPICFLTGSTSSNQHGQFLFQGIHRWSWWDSNSDQPSNGYKSVSANHSAILFHQIFTFLSLSWIKTGKMISRHTYRCMDMSNSIYPPNVCVVAKSLFTMNLHKQESLYSIPCPYLGLHIHQVALKTLSVIHRSWQNRVQMLAGILQVKMFHKWNMVGFKVINSIIFMAYNHILFKKCFCSFRNFPKYYG